MGSTDQERFRLDDKLTLVKKLVADYSELQPVLERAMQYVEQSKLDTIIVSVKDLISAHARHHISGGEAALDLQLASLTRIAGGAADGLHWWDSISNDAGWAALVAGTEDNLQKCDSASLVAEVLATHKVFHFQAPIPSYSLFDLLYYINLPDRHLRYWKPGTRISDWSSTNPT